MSNLHGLNGGARLPIFERLAKGESVKFPSIYDMTNAQVKRELEGAFARLKRAKEGKKYELVSQLELLIKRLTELARERGLVGVGHPQ